MTTATVKQRSGWSSRLLTVYAILIFAFLYIPILTIIVFSFDASIYPTLPIETFTLDW